VRRGREEDLDFGVGGGFHGCRQQAAVLFVTVKTHHGLCSSVQNTQVAWVHVYKIILFIDHIGYFYVNRITKYRLIIKLFKFG
jgi:hypothetical protein